MIKVNSQNFENEVINSDIPVLVDFYSETCMPCKKLMPILDQAESEYKGKFKIVKADVSENLPLTQKYRIMVSPTLLFFQNGSETDRIRGLVNRTELSHKIESMI